MVSFARSACIPFSSLSQSSGCLRTCDAGYGEAITLSACSRPGHIFALRSRNEFPITETELKLMAAAAIIGFNSNPKAGNITPAARGTPTALEIKSKNRFCLMFRMSIG